MSRPGLPILTAILVGIQLASTWRWAPGADDWLQDVDQLGAGYPRAGRSLSTVQLWLPALGFTHLLFNLTFLAYTGYNLERALGRLNLATLFLFSVFVGGHQHVDGAGTSLGASGGDFGLIAAVVFGWKHWDDIPHGAREVRLGARPLPGLLAGERTQRRERGQLGSPRRSLGWAAPMTMLAGDLQAQRDP